MLELHIDGADGVALPLIRKYIYLVITCNVCFLNFFLEEERKFSVIIMVLSKWKKEEMIGE